MFEYWATVYSKEWDDCEKTYCTPAIAGAFDHQDTSSEGHRDGSQSLLNTPTEGGLLAVWFRVSSVSTFLPWLCTKWRLFLAPLKRHLGGHEWQNGGSVGSCLIVVEGTGVALGGSHCHILTLPYTWRPARSSFGRRRIRKYCCYEVLKKVSGCSLYKVSRAVFV
jgi:hypothetical protein